jgi:hypothetical protein
MTAAEKEAFKKRMAAGRNKKAAGKGRKKGKRRSKKAGTRKKTSRKKAPKRRKAASPCAPRKKTRRTKRKTTTALAKRKPYKAKGKYKHGPRGQITAAQIINGASKAQLAAWICAGARRTGCGGGKRGGHVVMSTTLDPKTSRKFRRRLRA